MHVCGAPAEGAEAVFCKSNPLFCGQNPFCYALHELVYMKLADVDVLDWNLPRAGVCLPACRAVGPLEMLDGQPAVPMMCEHHQSWFDKLVVRRWASVFSGFVGTDFAPDTGPVADPIIIRGFRLMMAAYINDGGTGFHEQIAARAQGYTCWHAFAVALYGEGGTATGYLRYPFRIELGSDVLVWSGRWEAPDTTSNLSNLDK